jgi:hypothetical protein
LNATYDIGMNAFKLKNNRLNLLKELRSHVKTILESSDMNPNSTSDISDMMLMLQERKTARTLKIMRRELDKWIQEIEEDHKIL